MTLSVAHRAGISSAIPSRSQNSQIGQGYSIGELTDIVKARPDAVRNIVSVPDASQTVPAFFIDPVLNVKVEKVF